MYAALEELYGNGYAHYDVRLENDKAVLIDVDRCGPV